MELKFQKIEISNNQLYVNEKDETFLFFSVLFSDEKEKDYEATLEFRYFEEEMNLEIIHLYLLERLISTKNNIFDADLCFGIENAKDKIFEFIKKEIEKDIETLFSFCKFAFGQKNNIENLFKESKYVEEKTKSNNHYFEIKNNEQVCYFVVFYLRDYDGAVINIEININEDVIIKFPIVNYFSNQPYELRASFKEKMKDEFLAHKQIRIKKLLNLI